MKRKKMEYEEVDYDFNSIVIQRQNEKTFFEIGGEITTDLAEAVSIMMNNKIKNDLIWETEIEYNIKEISPSKCLYWLSGGKDEWETLKNYKKPWHECDKLFQEEFGNKVLDIMKTSKNLKDIKDGFTKHLNLPSLYNFAICHNLVK